MSPSHYDNQPGVSKRMTTPGTGVRSGTGSNTKGSGQAYGGPKGFFQWGHNQYGYINPTGDIKWDAQKMKGKPLAYGQVSPWAKQSNQLKDRRDEFGQPVSPARKPAGYLDPAYFAQATQLKTDRAMAQRKLTNELEQMKATYGLETGTFKDEYDRARSGLGASLGSRGLSRSGIAGREITEAEQGYQRGMESLGQQYGAPAQQRIKSQQSLIDSNLRAMLQSQQQLSKARFEYVNEQREASGLEPLSAAVPGTGFEKRGSTWFYTNPKGVTVSVKGSPQQKRIAHLERLLSGKPGVMPPTEQQEKTWRAELERLRGEQ